MMFGAGIGVGMLTWAVAEPVYHFNNNPEVIQGLATGAAADNIRNAYKWSFLHWGLGAWACYAIAGLALAFFSYRRGLPLTIRSSLTPLFGKSLSGPLGQIILSLIFLICTIKIVNVNTIILIVPFIVKAPQIVAIGPAIALLKITDFFSL